MAGGLFELRRDDITGWWVATVVDRQFERARFARPARRVATPDELCQNCHSAPNERVRGTVAGFWITLGLTLSNPLTLAIFFGFAGQLSPGGDN